MKHIYETVTDCSRELQEILGRMEYSVSAFSRFTSIPVTMFSPSFEILWEVNRAAKFCITNTAYTNPCSRCRARLAGEMKAAEEKADPSAFLCETGLLNLCYVLQFKGRTEGYFIAGPVAMGKDRTRAIADFYEKVPEEKIDVPLLMTMTNNLNVYTPEEVDDLSRMFTDVLNAAFAEPEAGGAGGAEEADRAKIPPEYEYSGRSNVIYNAAAYIQRHFRSITSLSEIADYVHVSRSYLSTLFKKETGIPIVDYVNGLRLAEAERELTGTRRDITDIALSVGFREASYFSRLFKKRYGMNPREYRAEKASS